MEVKLRLRTLPYLSPNNAEVSEQYSTSVSLIYGTYILCFQLLSFEFHDSSYWVVRGSWYRFIKAGRFNGTYSLKRRQRGIGKGPS